MNRVRIVAEAGVNHNGSLELAKKLVDVAGEVGADIVKFQCFRSELLASRFAPKAPYQEKAGLNLSQLEMLKSLELTQNDLRELQNYCERSGLEFLATPFDPKSAKFLTDELGLAWIKVGSGDLTNAPLLLQLAQAGRRLILSTGMSEMHEIEEALQVLGYGYRSQDIPKNRRDIVDSGQFHASLRDKVVLLHCTTEYPAPLESVNLRAMVTLRETFGLPVGYSDHTQGTTVAVAAAALGACVIEKHLTLDRSLPGPDHAASLLPQEFMQLVVGVRETERALGDSAKIAGPGELRNLPAARKSLVAGRAIRRGEIFTRDNLTVKRPGTGQSPAGFWDTLGKEAERDYEEDEPI